ncbi:MAG: ribosome assembly cofactor RimP [Prevotella sp.]|nr:ribosome assembly cofactor RimP [Prevotella sp.]
MITKATLASLAEEWLQGKDYFLVDTDVTADYRLLVEIDCKDGVWIEDCAELSRYIQERLGSEMDDYELEVGSAGIGQPFKVVQQYQIHVGDDVEVLTLDGKKLKGQLTAVDTEAGTFTLLTTEKQVPEGKKRPVSVQTEKTFSLSDGVKSCKYLLNFK